MQAAEREVIRSCRIIGLRDISGIEKYAWLIGLPGCFGRTGDTIDPAGKYPEYVIAGLTRNPAQAGRACFESLDTGFRRYGVYTVCSLDQ
jgi:hypothetical protein